MWVWSSMESLETLSLAATRLSYWKISEAIPFLGEDLTKKKRCTKYIYQNKQCFELQLVKGCGSPIMLYVDSNVGTIYWRINPYSIVILTHNHHVVAKESVQVYYICWYVLGPKCCHTKADKRELRLLLYFPFMILQHF